MALQFGGGTTFSVELEGPFGSSGTGVKLTSLSAPAAAWKGAAGTYSQVAAAEGVSMNSRVDITLDAAQLDVLRNRQIVFLAGNSEGIVTLYALGDRPPVDLTFQAALMEVTA